MIDYSKFQQSLKNLESQFEHYSNLKTDYPTFIKEGMAESVIQRFETCFDCMWKVLKRFLSEDYGVSNVNNSPKPVFRLAHENNLLPSSVEEFLAYCDARNSTAHDYSGEKALQSLELMPAFIADAIALYQTLSTKKWEL